MSDIKYTNIEGGFSISEEKQITFSEKNHALDNNDNFSPDNLFLCYDTRGTVFNDNLANCKSIEKVEIATGIETIIWKPKSITGEFAAPGVAAVSYHPTKNKVAFIHGPFVDEIDKRGYYDITNRTGVEVSADGEGKLTKLDMRDVTSIPTTPGAHRGGTHRHEYSRKGNRIGCTYDDFLLRNYDRTIAFMQESATAPNGYSHYFSLIVKPVEKGKSKAGEIEKAHSDSWVGSKGNKRAFIGKIRAKNGVDYENSLFVAEIPESIDITTANAGSETEYPTPAEGIIIKRLTHSKNCDGIVRASNDGKFLAYYDTDSVGIKQIFIIPVDGSDIYSDHSKHPRQLTNFKSDASFVRWHSSGNYVFCITDGNVMLVDVEDGDDFGKTIYLTNDNKKKSKLVVSCDDKIIAYTINVLGKEGKKFQQIFTLSFK
jgi:hypothetical protein